MMSNSVRAVRVRRRGSANSPSLCTAANYSRHAARVRRRHPGSPKIAAAARRSPRRRICMALNGNKTIYCRHPVTNISPPPLRGDLWQRLGDAPPLY